MQLYLEDALAAAALLMSAVMLLLACASYLRTHQRRVIAPAIVAAGILAVALLQVLQSSASDAPPEGYMLWAALAEIGAIAAVYAIWLLRGRGGE